MKQEGNKNAFKIIVLFMTVLIFLKKKNISSSIIIVGPFFQLLHCNSSCDISMLKVLLCRHRT